MSGFIIAVDAPCPIGLRPSAIGVGWSGPPDSLHLVFHEDFDPQETLTIRRGEFTVGLKLFNSDRVAGLAWKLAGRSLAMVGFAPYSLRYVADRLGANIGEEFAGGARRMSCAGLPGVGLLLRVVFVDPGSGLVFGLRAFTLPRLFSDRWLAAILATDKQDLEVADARVKDLLSCGPDVWGRCLPGIAASGEETELDEGEWRSLIRRRHRRSP